MCQCGKVKDRDRERQTSPLQLHSASLPQRTTPRLGNGLSILSQHPSKPQSELWEQRADVSLLGGLGKHTRLAPHPHNPRQNKSLEFWKGMDYGSRIFCTQQGAADHQDQLGPAPHSQPSEHSILCKHALRESCPCPRYFLVRRY